VLTDLIDSHRGRPLRLASTGSRLFVASNCSDELTTGSEYRLLKSKNDVLLTSYCLVGCEEVR